MSLPTQAVYDADCGIGTQALDFAARYRALLRSDFTRALNATGFGEITWLDPATTSFYQPIVLARKLSTR